MTDREKMILGAIGGGLVAVVGYPIAGFDHLMGDEESMMLGVGFVIRTAGCAFFGGLWAYLHRSETDRLKVFQLGLLGPAIVSAMVYANMPKADVSGSERDVAATLSELRLPGLIGTAHAQSKPAPKPVATPPKEETSWDLIVRGILGTSSIKDK